MQVPIRLKPFFRHDRRGAVVADGRRLLADRLGGLKRSRADEKTADRFRASNTRIEHNDRFVPWKSRYGRRQPDRVAGLAQRSDHMRPALLGQIRPDKRAERVSRRAIGADAEHDDRAPIRVGSRDGCEERVQLLPADRPPNRPLRRLFPRARLASFHHGDSPPPRLIRQTP
ncbi:hypothetical protein BG53_05190 [Paenibacillus darwinianus]|uniref:Uncharacterized protein n=1 Tax=Paenibacillus darwinianus TaxID=1380763 RepID=A0A9W5RZY1_9BACL|nr:hypothetical protein BG52_08825 [Paenibacillus darwinianus]EXX86830.1 hypothetical protein CH50_06565 [Paenibacillus darwinianus]EXX86859.1 hypothetical protein BG53_05190 [Paenibacillus darwinianus]